MIRKNSLFCKLLRVKKTSARLFQECMERFSCSEERCPYCQAKEACVPHGYYERNIIDFIKGKTFYSKVCVLRVCCKACGHTHAVLPDVVVPYATYSLFFILRVLAEYFAHVMTIEALCSRFAITSSMLYRWKGIFLLHKEHWLGAIEVPDLFSFLFIRNLCSLNDYSTEFSSPFIALTNCSFLQQHETRRK